MLEAQGVNLAYGARRALAGVDLTVRAGEFVALCGPNGAGKSSLIGALSGDIRPSAGETRIVGAPVHGMKAADLALRRAVLEQSPAISGAFTVEALARMGVPRACGVALTDDLAARAVADVGLTEQARLPVATLSGGQQRRAHLARTMAQLAGGRALDHGDALLLDEPTAGLDIAHQIVALEAAQAEAAKGAAVIAALHDLSAAARYADRIVLMAAGKIVADAPPRAALTPDRLSNLYGAPMQVFDAPDGALVVAPLYATPQADTGKDAPHVSRHEPLQNLQRQRASV